MNEWTCSCGYKNTTPFCVQCGKPKPQSADDKNDDAEWTCSCGQKNTTAFCTACGNPKDARQSDPPPATVVDDPPAPPTPAPSASNDNLKIYLLMGAGFLVFMLAGAGALFFSFFSETNVSSKTPTTQNVLPVQAVEEVEQLKPSSSIPNTEENTPVQSKREVQPVKTVPPLGGNWISDPRTDVYIWNPEPRADESITWSGGYVQDGDYKYADGSGTVTWYRNNNPFQVDTGSFERGRHHGQFKHELASGNVIYSRWEHGKEIPETNVNLEEAKETFLYYHKSITARDFRAAYNMLSNNQRQRMGDLNSYTEGYKTTISSTITDINLISGDGNTYKFGYRLQARDTYRGNKVLVQEFEGQVTLVKYNGRWLIDNTQSKKISERVE